MNSNLRRLLAGPALVALAATQIGAVAGGPSVPLNNFSLVQLGAPATNGLVSFIDTSTVPPRAAVMDVWLVRIGLTDVPLEPLLKAPSMGDSVGYWNQVRIDCVARTLDDRYSAYFDLQGRIGPVWPFPPKAVPIGPGSQEERIYNATCQAAPPSGYPRVTSLTAAIGMARPAAPPATVNLAWLWENAPGAAFLMDTPSISRTADGRNAQAWTLATSAADTVQNGVASSAQWLRWSFDCQNASGYLLASANVLAAGGVTKAANRVTPASPMAPDSTGMTMLNYACGKTAIPATARRFTSAAAAITAARAGRTP